MRIANLPGVDTGGNGWRTREAFARHAPDWTYDLCTGSVKYMDYPKHLDWSQARRAYLLADVVHHRNSFRAQRILEVPRKPGVIQHHGTKFRTYTETLLGEQRRHRAIGLASTLDLWLLAPDELEWLPSPYDLDWLASLRREQPDDGVLRIAHAPTNRQVKSTAAFLNACSRLARETPVEITLIENQTWKSCLSRKAQADIYFDQVTLGYGNNALESWGMGIPVVAGAQPDTLAEMERRFGSLPFVLADEGTIYQALASLADPEARKLAAKRGHEHVRRFHDEAVVVEQLKSTYQRALDQS